MSLLAMPRRWATEAYYQLAQRDPRVALLHDRARRLRNHLRYGVNASYMFHAVELEINSMCNRRCGYCPNSFAKRPSGYMDRAVFDKIIGELGAMNYDGRVSYHFYGEPLLDKRLPDMVRDTRLRVPRAFIEIYSNGDFLTLPIFRDYLARGLDNFLITQHDNEVPENLQQILDAATPDERGKLVIRFAKDRNLINRSGLIAAKEGDGKPPGASASPCDWPLSIMVITQAGNVVLCCNDYFESEVIGNVASDSLREVWTNDKFTAFRAALARGDRSVSKLCVDCDYVPVKSRLDRIVAG